MLNHTSDCNYMSQKCGMMFQCSMNYLYLRQGTPGQQQLPYLVQLCKPKSLPYLLGVWHLTLSLLLSLQERDQLLEGIVLAILTIAMEFFVLLLDALRLLHKTTELFEILPVLKTT